jgi:hypothetical protein
LYATSAAGGDFAIYNQAGNGFLMRKYFVLTIVCLFFSPVVFAQSKRLWVLDSGGEAVEYDPATFIRKHAVKLPPEAGTSPVNVSIDAGGQILFAVPVALPLAEADFALERKVWLWDGHETRTLNREVTRTTSTAGSNLSIQESVAVPVLSADGAHLFWFSNQARRLQRDGVDLSTKNTWTAWRTDLAGASREDLASVTLPDCSCPTGGCEDSCAYGLPWAPDSGVDRFFLLTQFIAGQTKPVYRSTSLYEQSAGKWAASAVEPPLRIVLDAANPEAILAAIPDTGCCGWSNESDDQTLLRLPAKTVTVFAERSAYRNPDYDVTFFTENGKLSPDLKLVAMTIAATSKPNTPIQLAEQGQANPEESLRIRKALGELPAVEIKTTEDTARRVAFLPHAVLIGWIGEKEILLLEDHLLVAYNVATGVRRKSTIHAEDAAHVFLR